MDHPIANADERERRLDQAVTAWIKAAEDGAAPDPQAWLQRYPDLAPELESFFAADERIGQVAALRHEAPTLNTPRVASIDEAETIGPTGEPAPADTPGRLFGEYELLAEIARGGMGVVYKARQTRLNRTVAIKMILAGELANEGDVRRFRAEAEAAAALDHPGIVPIYESGEISGQHFFSMGFVDGHSLAAALAAGPLTPRRAAELMAQVADAVAYAHAQGVIHRDLKPGNILLDKDGRPRVTDFGLAKRVAGDSGLTHTGQALGTPSFMPPEQASGKLDAIGPASDVYALGAVLYALVTGRPPFQAASPLDTLIQVLEQEPVAPRQLNPDVPRDLETISLKCLEKDPHKRYGAASQLAAELRRFLRGEPIEARPIRTSERAWRWCRRNPLVAALAATAVLTLILGAGFSSYFAFAAHRRAVDAELSAKAASEAETREKRQRLAAQDAQKSESKQRVAAQAAEARETQERLKAQRQLRMATALRLAAQAHEALPDRPQRATLLAIAAVNATVSSGEPRLVAAEQALRDCLSTVSGRVISHAQSSAIAMAIDPITGELLTLGSDRVVRSWDLATGEPSERSWTLPAAPGVADASLRYALFSPDARWVVTVGGVLPLHQLLREPLDGKPDLKSWNLAPMSGPQPSFHFAPDSRWLFGSSAAWLGIGAWNLSAPDPTTQHLTLGGRILPSVIPLRDSFQLSAAISPDGRWLALSSAARGLEYAEELWDLKAPEPRSTRRQLSGPSGWGARLAFSPDSRWLAVGHTAAAAMVAGKEPPPAVQIWDMTQPPDVAPQSLTASLGDVQALAFSGDDRWLAVASWSGGLLFDLADRSKNAAAHSLSGASWNPGIDYLAFPHGDRWLATVGRAGHVRLWDLRADDPTIAPIALAENTSGARHLTTTPDGRMLVVVGGDNAIRLWNLAADDPSTTGVVLRGQEGTTSDVFFSSTGRWLVAGPGHPRRWDLTNLEAAREPYSTHAVSDRWLRPHFSPDGRWLVAPERWKPVVYDLSASEPFDEPHHLAMPRAAYVDAFSHDGRRLAVAAWSGDGKPRYWDLSSGQPMLEGPEPPPADQSIAPAPSPAQSLAFSSDDRWLIAVTGQQQVALFEPGATPSAAEPLRLSGHQVARSPDNRWLVTVDAAGLYHRWDLTQAPPTEVTFACGNSGDGARQALLSASGRHLFTLHSGKRARLWGIEAGKAKVLDLGKAKDEPASVLFLPGERWLAYLSGNSGEYGTVRLCDLNSADPTGSFADLTGHTGHVLALSTDASGRRLVSSSNDGTVRVWNLVDPPEIITSLVLRPTDPPDHHLAISPNGRWVAVGGEKQFAVQLWDLEGGDDVTNPVLLHGHTSPIKAVSFSADNRWLLATNGSQGVAKLWRVALPELINQAQEVAGRTLTNEERSQYRLDEAPPPAAEPVRLGVGRDATTVTRIRQYLAAATSIAISPDSRRFVSGGWYGAVKLCDCEGTNPSVIAQHVGPVWGVAFSPDGQRFASAGGDGKLLIGRLGGAVIEVVAHEGGAHDVAYDGSGARLATCGADGAVKLWNAADGRLLATLAAHKGAAWGVAFDTAGTRLASAGHDKLVKVWDVTTGRELARCVGHTDVAWDVAFSPDGRLLASASDDRTVKIWDSQTGETRLALTGHSITPYRVAFSPDGKLIGSAAADRWQHGKSGEILVWETDNGQLYARHRDGSTGFFGLAIAPDGSELVGAASDGVLRVWKLNQKTTRPAR